MIVSLSDVPKFASVKDEVATFGGAEALRRTKMDHLRYWLDASREESLRALRWIGRNPAAAGYHAAQAAHLANIACRRVEEM